jgi:transposase
VVFKKSKGELELTGDEEAMLKKLSASRINEARIVERSKILLMYSQGEKPDNIAESLSTNRQKVYRIINKALSLGIEPALQDARRTGKPRSIGDPARSYIIRIACTKPSDLGKSYEMWTNRSLTEYIKENAPEDYNLSNIANGTVSKILRKSRIRPYKITYYEEKTDPDFDIKEREILHVYKEVEIYRKNGSRNLVALLSYDEKPGIQATGNLYADKPPSVDHGTWSRNHDYKRLGTLSLLAGIDLLTGEVTHIVRERHRSIEFIEFLKLIDSKFPEGYVIAIMLDNHSIHKSAETQRYLNVRKGRFRFVFTPVHASWLNIVETMFSRMARSFLRGIRVETKEELKERIDMYFDEVNKEPVEFIWEYKMDEMPGGINPQYSNRN